MAKDRFDVGLEIDSYIDNIAPQVEEYWAINQVTTPDDDEEEIKFRTALSEATLTMVKAAMQLHQRQGQDIKGTLQSFKDDGHDLTKNPIVRDFAELEMVFELKGMVDDMAGRALRLLDYLCDVKGDVTRSYLLRVARSYIFGMHPEAIVMCGAVLEAALDQWLPSDDKTRTLGIKIRDLEGSVLTDVALQAARTINRLRTDAVHLRLERLPPDAIEVVQLLNEVLSSMEAGGQ